MRADMAPKTHGAPLPGSKPPRISPLAYQRLLRGWSQNQLARERYQRCQAFYSKCLYYFSLPGCLPGLRGCASKTRKAWKAPGSTPPKPGRMSLLTRNDEFIDQEGNLEGCGSTSLRSGLPCLPGPFLVGSGISEVELCTIPSRWASFAQDGKARSSLSRGTSPRCGNKTFAT